MATTNQVRQLAIELQDNVETIKTAVDALKTAVDAIHTETTAWVVNDVDGSLPSELDVQSQLLAYEALSTGISKPSNNLTDTIASVKAAV